MIVVQFLLEILNVYGLFVSGTPLFGGSETMRIQRGMTAIRAGIFDDVGLVEQYQPTAELYAPRRPKWIGPVENAHQLTDMPPVGPEGEGQASN